jgi:hypothetical protein
MAGQTRGAAPKITPAVEARLLQLLQAGATKRDASQACGINEDTLYRHLKKSADFAERLTKAQAEAACANVLVVRKAAQAGTWQAAAWWLERRRPEDWGRIDRLELTGKDRKPIEINVSSYSTEQLGQIRDLLRQPAQAARNGRNGTREEESP